MSREGSCDTALMSQPSLVAVAMLLYQIMLFKKVNLTCELTFVIMSHIHGKIVAFSR